INPGFFRRMREGRPHVRCKLAMSLDGRTAMASGESKWITSDAARNDVQRLRARSSAIVTGIETVLADDPSMNVRLPITRLPGVEHPEYLRQPLRVVLDTRLRMPPRARMLTLPGDTLVVCGESASRSVESELRELGADVLRLPQLGGRLELDQLLRQLAERQVNEVLIESGPTLAGSALAAGIIDELVVYMAPHLMGDAARGLVRMPGVDRMADRFELRFKDSRMVGADLRLLLTR
ncbi:MAG: bifunctional diaminohydroxyphosphoribosylaminopyrimidine deaminase/5-amino-6-(5-phosphoribosylamino)uracil reductase RibD, partial [Gammaproteobacteria bacterium]|nr:bifunctional diaminohydroxyphosphoribosylaminopyrimidine deaminase/5-amino-6-(5-phosphoribosylamino)uracil reductase RibD [Gammaproteobacteria bacterium]